MRGAAGTSSNGVSGTATFGVRRWCCKDSQASNARTTSAAVSTAASALIHAMLIPALMVAATTRAVRCAIQYPLT